jgi:hypothetical protein
MKPGGHQKQLGFKRRIIKKIHFLTAGTLKVTYGNVKNKV